MTPIRHAILAALLAASLGFSIDPRDPPEPPAETSAHLIDPPLAVRFRLRDGVRIPGGLTSWDFVALDGTFGRRVWRDLATADVWRLFRILMDRDDAREWVELGRLLLPMPDNEDWPEQSFRRALQIDADAQPLIDEARARVAEEERARRERDARVEEARLQTGSPEGRHYGTSVWPVLTAEQQAVAVRDVKAEAQKVLDLAGLQIVPVETDFYVLYTDAPRPEAARLVTRLDRLHRALVEFFGLDASTPHYWGKAVVLIFEDRDRFDIIQAEAFRQLVSRGTVAMAHFRGPQAFIVAHRADDADDDALLGALCHEAVHAFMHRYRSPRRLPLWANEGFANWITAEALGLDAWASELRERGYAVIRGGASIAPVFEQGYEGEDGSAPGAEGYPVGLLTLELMNSERPDALVDWINATKDGRDWVDGLREVYGVDGRALIERVTRYYMVND